MDGHLIVTHEELNDLRRSVDQYREQHRQDIKDNDKLLIELQHMRTGFHRMTIMCGTFAVATAMLIIILILGLH